MAKAFTLSELEARVRAVCRKRADDNEVRLAGPPQSNYKTLDPKHRPSSG